MSTDRQAQTVARTFAGGVFVAVALAAIFGGPVMADNAAPDSENGRYTLSPTADGVIRLDSRTGAISVCNSNTGTGWACYAVPDERAALDAEIGRLQGENDKLKTELASRDQSVSGKIDGALPKDSLPKDQVLPKSDQLQKTDPKLAQPKTESKANDGTRKIEIPLPSDEDMNRVMGFVEQAWRRLIDMANRVQRDVSGRI